MENNVDKSKAAQSTKGNQEEKGTFGKSTKSINWKMQAKAIAFEGGSIFLNGILFGLGSLAAHSIVNKARTMTQSNTNLENDNIVQMRRQQVGNA